MSIDAGTLRRYTKPAVLSTKQSLLAVAVVGVSLLFVATALHGQSPALAQAPMVGPGAGVITQDFQASTSWAAQADSSAQPDAEPAIYAAPAIIEAEPEAAAFEASTVVEPEGEAGFTAAEAAIEPLARPDSWSMATVEQDSFASQEGATAAVEPAKSVEASVFEAAVEEQAAPSGEPVWEAPGAVAPPPSPPAPAVAPAAIALKPLEASMLGAINARRAAAGLRPVSPDPTLTEVSRQRSNDMANRNYFSHTTPEGTGFIDALNAHGITTGTVGEILGRNNASDDASVSMVVEAFTQSPSHNLHLVYSSYEWAGVGVAVGANSMKYYTIIFRARP
jgi:uncharacterized protein YkwD